MSYAKYATRNGLCSYLLEESEGHISYKITGKNAGKLFSQEIGKHVIQRVPPTETKGRRQTSVVVVGILPMPPENSIKPLRAQDLEVIVQTGKQGAGGQNVNRVHSAVRMKHKPTGLHVFINGRDQGWNKKEALRILTAKVNELQNNEVNQAYGSLRHKQLGNTGRGDKIRTYNYIESRAVDHRTGVKTRNPQTIIEKGLFEVFLAPKKEND